MRYIRRHIEPILHKMLSQFKVVLVTGPRQVGKSTLLKNELKDFEYVTLDDMSELELARTDPAIFFKNHSFPLGAGRISWIEIYKRYYAVSGK